jgi:rRNA-processing protein FCF1
MIKIILDTNFLVYCAENKIDYKEGIENLVNEGIELVVPFQVIDELKDLAENSSKFSDKQAARLALKLLEHNKVRELVVRGVHADEAILNILKKEKAIVATIDYQLRKKVGMKNRAIVIEGMRKIVWD